MLLSAGRLEIYILKEIVFLSILISFLNLNIHNLYTNTNCLSF